MGFYEENYHQILINTAQPHHNAIFRVCRKRPCYKGNCVIMRLFTFKQLENNNLGAKT